MSVQALPDTLHAYELGSEPVATLSQTCAWNADAVPVAAGVSSSRVHPAGPVAVADAPSSSRPASSRSPATIPAGAATLVPLVTLERERKPGGGAAVVNAASPETARSPFTSRLRARKWYVVSGDRPVTAWPWLVVRVERG